MQVNSLATSFAAHWKQVLGGLVAAFLLLPLPAFAAIDFSALSWTFLHGGGDTIVSSVTSTGSDSDHGVLNIFLAAGVTNAAADTKVTITSSVLSQNEVESIDGAWASDALGKIFNITNGPITVAVGIDPSTNNMFSEEVPSASTDLTDQLLSGSVETPITFRLLVTITVEQDASYSTSSTPMTLTFVNGIIGG